MKRFIFLLIPLVQFFLPVINIGGNVKGCFAVFYRDKFL